MLSAGSDSTALPGYRRPVSRDDILALARSALGTPWRHQGRQPGIGLDCAGLVLWVAHELGLSDFEITDYPRLPRGDRLIGLATAAGFVPREVARPGDVLCMAMVEHPQHLAISTGRGIVHACMQRGRVVEHRVDAGWRRRIRSVFAFPGIDA